MPTSSKSLCPNCGGILGRVRLHHHFECPHCKKKYKSNGPWIGVIGSTLTYFLIYATDIMFNNFAVTLLVGMTGIGVGMLALFELTSFQPESSGN